MAAATVGNVQGERPAIWDMLGRAKWCALSPWWSWITNPVFRDEWAKHKDLDSYEAKWLYVDALLKVMDPHAFDMQDWRIFQVLKKYSGKTVANKLVEELESYDDGPANTELSRMHLWLSILLLILNKFS